MPIPRSERFPLRLTPGERRLLDRIADAERRSAAEVMRDLLRGEARKRDMWPPDEPEPEGIQEVRL